MNYKIAVSETEERDVRNSNDNDKVVYMQLINAKNTSLSKLIYDINESLDD